MGRGWAPSALQCLAQLPFLHYSSQRSPAPSFLPPPVTWVLQPLQWGEPGPKHPCIPQLQVPARCLKRCQTQSRPRHSSSPLGKGDAADSWLLPKQARRKNPCRSTRVRKRKTGGAGGSTPLAQAPGTGAPVGARSLGTAMAELTLAGAHGFRSRLALPMAVSPSTSPRDLEGGQHPHSPTPRRRCPSASVGTGTWGDGCRRREGGWHPAAPHAHPVPPSPGRAQVPFLPTPGAGGGRGRIRACLGHVPSFAA